MATSLHPFFGNPQLHFSGVNSKHMVMEIKGGEMTMNEYTCQTLLRKVKACCSVSDSRPSGLITYRDCKRLLSDSGYIANIDTRFQCILVRIYPVCCIILRDSVLVVANGNMNLDKFINNLCSITRDYNLRDGPPSSAIPAKAPSEDAECSVDSSLSFEIKVLECCYSTALGQLEEEMATFEAKFRLVEQMLADKHKYEDINIILHELKQPVKNMNEILTGFSNMMDECLSNKNDLKLLEFDSHLLFYGPESLHSVFDGRMVNGDLENLLEYFDQEVEQMSRRSHTLGTSLSELETHLTVSLAIIRNKMMRFNLICSIVSIAFAAGACLTGLFGMNVVNSFEASHTAFIVISLVALAILVFAGVVARLLIYRHRV